MPEEEGSEDSFIDYKLYLNLLEFQNQRKEEALLGYLFVPSQELQLMIHEPFSLRTLGI